LVAFTIGAILRRTGTIIIQARIQLAGPSISTTGNKGRRRTRRKIITLPNSV
jgi:hypothetical protein